MDEENFDSEDSVFVQIDPRLSEEDESEDLLNMYLEKMTENESVVVKLSKSRDFAIVKPINAEDSSTLKIKIEKNPLPNYKISLKPCPAWDKIIVNGLQEDAVENVNKYSCDSVLGLYFESERICPSGGDVNSISILPCQHAAIVEFKDPAVVKRLPDKHTIPDGPTFETRPLGLFEYVEGPVCSVCNQSRNEDMETDDEDCDAHDKETKVTCSTDSNSEDEKSSSEDICNEDGTSEASSTEELEKLEKWAHTSGAECSSTLNKDRNASKSIQNSSSTGKNLYTPTNSDKTSILYKTIKYKKMPEWNSEMYETIKLRNHRIEICRPDPQNRIKTALDDANGFGEVDLSNYTIVAKRLNCKEGRKWITELLEDLQHPVIIKEDKSAIILVALNLKLAEDAAKTVAQSLLPAKVSCNRKEMNRLSKDISSKKNSVFIVEKDYNSGFLKMLGMPIHVIEAVRDIEKQLCKL